MERNMAHPKTLSAACELSQNRNIVTIDCDNFLTVKKKLSSVASPADRIS